MFVIKNPEYRCSCDLTYFRQLTPMNVLPISREFDIKKMKPIAKHAAPVHVLDTELDDDKFQEVHPPRTKTDLIIRRLRWTDIRPLVSYEAAMIMSDVNLDYIHTINLYLYTLVHPEGVATLKSLREKGALMGFDQYIEFTTEMNRQVKTGNVPIEQIQEFAEMQSLTGFRNPPIPGFDVVKEVEALANGGTERNESWSDQFDKATSDMFEGLSPDPVPFVTIEDFMEKIATAGASGLKGELNIEKETIKLPLKKNMLPFYYTKEELLKRFPNPIQLNKAFVKPEPAKLRIAVTGDFDSYLLQSYLLHFVNNVYLQIPGISLQENARSELRRHYELMRRLRQSFALPFDYANFDHQALTREVKRIVRSLLLLGKANIPDSFVSRWLELVEVCVESFSNSYLQYFDRQKHLFRVKGGVESGIKLTSLIGNLWNLVTMHICTRFAAVDYLEVRGDDSNLVDDDWRVLLLSRLVIASNNINGSDRKFSIHNGRSEFLRVWYTAERLHGITNRVIVGLSQQKPWNNTPWTPEQVTTDLIGILKTIERRTQRKLPKIETMITNAWQRARKLDKRWLQLPRHMGGLGILEFKGYSVTNNVSFPEFKIDKLAVKTPLLVRPDWQKRLQMDFSLDIQTQISNDYFTKLLAFDEIRAVAKRMRNKYTSFIDTLRPKLSKAEWVDVGTSSYSIECMELEKTLDPDIVYSTISNSLPARFTKYRHLYQRWLDLTAASQYDKNIHPSRIIFNEEPDFRSELAKIERRGYRRSTAISMLLERKMPGTINPILHPLAHDVVQMIALRSFSRQGDVVSRLQGRTIRTNRYLQALLDCACMSVINSAWYKSLLSNW